MKRLLLSTVGAAGVLAFASVSSQAGLSIAFQNGVNTFACVDGQICDLSGPTSDLLILNQQIGAFHVEGNFAASTFGAVNSLSDSNLTITNTSGTSQTLNFSVGDVNFLPVTAFASMSGSGTFENSIGGSGALSFHGDTLNRQSGTIVGGVPTAFGTLLFNPSRTVATDPDAFSGNDIFAPFHASAPFSMALDYTITLPAGGSIVGLESAITTGIPESSTWAMSLVGFGLLALGWRYKIKQQPRAITT